MIVNAGPGAVTVFMVISGFVITHLITERPEPYGVYLLRRFARIFPLFFVMCAVAFFTNDILVDALALAPWASESNFFLPEAREIVASEHQFFWSTVLAHLLLLHGAISSKLIPLSPYTFVGPGWSLSLEWQFYLLAPLAVMLATRSIRWLTWIALAVAVGELMFHDSPSFFREPLDSSHSASPVVFAFGIYPTLRGARLAYRA